MLVLELQSLKRQSQALNMKYISSLSSNPSFLYIFFKIASMVDRAYEH